MAVRRVASTGTWYYRFMRDGNVFYKGRYRTKQQAEDAQVRLLDKIIQGVICPERSGDEMPVAEAADAFYTEYSRKQKRSWEIDKARLPVIKEFFGSKKIAQITQDDVQRFRDWLLAKGLKPLTVNHYHALLKAMVNWLGKTGRYSGSNNASKVKPYKIPRARVRYLLPEEEGKLSQVIASEYSRLWPYYVVALHTGMRLSEICRLKPDSLSDTDRTLFIPDSKTGTSRYVPVTPGLFTFLKSTVATGGFTRFTVSRWFGRAASKAGVGDIVFHDLRHTFAHRLLSAGVPVYSVSKILGHSSVKVTEAHYGHLGNKDLHDAAKVIDGVINLHNVSTEAKGEAVKLVVSS